MKRSLSITGDRRLTIGGPCEVRENWHCAKRFATLIREPTTEMSFSGLPAPDTEHGTPRLRICVASIDVAGPYTCGGVGAAFHGLALALARGGHEVTLLYVHDSFRRGSAAEWEDYFSRHGVRFVHLPQPHPGPVWYGGRKEASLDCYRWLAAHGPFDVIHSHEWLGLPYYTLVAKRLGLAFSTTTLVVGTHGPMRWSREGEERLAAMREDLVVDFMERRSVELADVVVSPSRYMLEWMRADGWRLPDRSYVAQNVLEVPERAATADTASRPMDEIVFFGRLDRRKGVPFFCDVVDRLYARGVPDFAVTFLGSSIHFDGKSSDEYVRARATVWARQPRIVTDMSREEALTYLMGKGRLAVMPARADNLPCTVHECVQLGIPFLATDVGGAPELIAAEDRAAVLCAPDPDRFAARLAEILAQGQRPARAAVGATTTEARWLGWHDTLGGERATTHAAPNRARELPFVSVCIAHYERPALLDQMLASLEHQTYERFEVIVSVDGSSEDATMRHLDELERRFAKRDWTLLRGPNRGPAGARHAAAEKARGEYLLFLDDDDVTEPHAIETLVRAALYAGVDALVPVHRSFVGDDAPHADTPVRRWFIPLGPALAASLVYPETGGSIILLRKDVYFACGGFPVARDVDEDWELLVTLIADGYDLDVVPEPLLWYRDQEQSRSRADNRFRRTRSRVALFERMLPLELRDLASLALVRLAGADDSEGLRRLERVRQVLDRRQGRKAANTEK
jgi:GT2 family glycosyltransferase/glycosyltransferase involved in cell wall biosynthesis